MFCKNCGKEIETGTKFCPNCGESVSFEIVNLNSSNSKSKNISPKSRTIAALLAFFLGAFGIHRFYVGKVGTGILQLLLDLLLFTTGTLFIMLGFAGCIWALIDFIVIICGNFKDKNGLLVTDWNAKY